MAAGQTTPSGTTATPAGLAGKASRNSTPQRRTRSSASTSGGSLSGGMNMGSAGVFRMWYNEDSPGLQVGPIMVLIASLVFLFFVAFMHAWGRMFA
eukprot:TRINITY_DN15362_c0_g1_i1.p1 TRINITY_DN15362_c0_g1~~TRINITY_DN15362_c0_g1_i1.p1  ORF type:complete len:109 (-),score=18.79 TRINITY_DN15362_c0_g1_i1:47-334(-)